MVKSPPRVSVEALHDTVTIDDRSRNVLVLLTGTEADRRLVREAGTYVAGTGGNVVLVSLMTPSEFTERQQAYAPIDHLPTFSVRRAEDACRQDALHVGHETLGPLGIDFTPVGMVGRETDCLLDAAGQHECGHLFLVERPRSLFRRLVARSLGHALTRKFDGLVTVLQPDPDEDVTGKRRWTTDG